MGAPKKKVVLAWIKKEYGKRYYLLSEADTLNIRRYWNICGSRTKISKYKDPCCFTPMKNGRCKKHGGKSLKGVAHPNYEDGATSKYIPPPMVEAVKSALSDANILSLIDEIAFIDAAMELSKKKMATGEPGSTWLTIFKAWAVFAKAWPNDADTMNEQMPILHIAITQVKATYEAMREYKEWGEVKRKFIETEIKSLEKMRRLITQADARWYLRKIGDANREAIMAADYIPEQDRFRLIRDVAEALDRATGGSALRPPDLVQ